MSCLRPCLLIVTTLVACGPSTGDATGGSTGAPDEASTGESPTTESPTTDATPTTSPDDETTADPTAADPTDDPTTGTAGACDVTRGDHAAACRDPGCPIALDLEIRCHDFDFASRGMAVAPAPDAVWLATGSFNSPLLFRADADGVAAIPGVVETYTDTTLLMTQGPDGAPHLAVEAPDPFGPGVDLRHLGLVDGTWTDTVILDSDEMNWLHDIDVDGQGRPHAFFYASLGEDFSVAVRDQDTWTIHSLPDPGSWAHFLLGPADEEIGLGVADPWLRAVIGDATITLGSPLPSSGVQYQAATGAPGPTIAVALQHDDRLELAWWPAPATVDLPATPILAGACDPLPADGPDTVCPGPCHDGNIGVLSGAFSFARTADGVGWLAWIVTHRDRDFTYQLTMLEGDYFCAAGIDRDDSFGVLHLARVDFAGAPTEVLTLPLSDVAGNLYEDGYVNRRSPVVLTAFNADLALALRLVGDEPPYQERPYARVLRLDTTQIP